MPLIRESAELNRRERDKIEYLTPGSPVNYSLLSAGIIAGDTIKVINGGTATVTVLSSNAATVTSLLPGTDATFVALVSSPTTPANFKAILTSMDPTALSDAAATRMGMKFYLHGTTYNSGIAPTITLVGGGGSLSSVYKASFVPYQMQNGSWRCKFNISVALSVAGRSFAQLSINGMTFGGVGAGQAISAGAHATGASKIYASAQANVSTVIISHSSVNTDEYTFSGDVELASKPTWAY